MLRKRKYVHILLSLMAILLFLLGFAWQSVQAQMTRAISTVGSSLDGDATDVRGNVINEDKVAVKPIDRLIIHKLDLIGARKWWCMPIWQPYWCIEYHPIVRGHLRPAQVICPPPRLINWCWWPRRCIRLYPTLIPGILSDSSLPPELPPNILLDPRQFDEEKEAYFVGLLRVRTIRGKPVGRFYIGGTVVFRRVHVVCRPSFCNVYWPICWRWWDLRPELDPTKPINMHLKNRSWYWCWRPTRLLWVIPIRDNLPVNHDLSRLIDDPELPDIANNSDSLVSNQDEQVDIGHIRHRVKFRLTAAMGPIGNTGANHDGPPAAMVIDADCDSFFDILFNINISDSQSANER